MNKAYLFFLMILLSMTIGCASLEIDVDVYKPPIPQSPESLVRLARSVLSEPVFDSGARPSVYETVLQPIREQYIARINATPEGKNSPNAAEGLWTMTKANIDSAWEPVSAKAADTYAAAAAVDRSMTYPEDAKTFDSQTLRLRGALASYDAEVDIFLTQVRQALGTILSAPTINSLVNVARSTLTVRGIAASAELNGRAIGHPLFNDRIAMLSPEVERWSPFSSAAFHAFGGNSQFVVIREGHLVFRQKSLDFDPTPVVGAGTAMTRLGLQVAAAMAIGSSVTQKESSKTEVDKSTLVNEAELEANSDLLEHRRKARQNLLIEFAKLLEETVAAESQPTDEKIKDIRTRLESAISFFQGMILKPEGNK